MSRGRLLIGCAAGAVLLALALVLAGSRPAVVRTFSLDVPDQYVVAVLRRGARVCEGPVSSREQVGGVAIWGAPLARPARLTVQVLLASSQQPVSSGVPVLTRSLNEYRAPIAGQAAAGRPLEVCVAEHAGAFALAGFPMISPLVAMSGRVPGPQPSPIAGHVFSLALLSAPGRSFLSWLPLAFGRASLWRPGWVGRWTFWVLTVALLVAFGLVALSVALGAAADEDREARRAPPPPAAEL